LAGLLAGLLAARAVPRPRERRRRAALPAGAGLLAAAAVALALGSRQLSLQPLLADLGVVASTFACAFVVLALVGLAFEYLFIRPVYRDPLRQILVTVGASYLIAELLKAVWGPASLSMGMPSTLVGGLSLGGVVIEKYRLLAAACGLLVYLGLQALVHRTRAGLLIRAGVENVEMVEALGYRVRLLFLAVFVGGAALAGLGGAMWGLYQGQVGTGMGAEMLVMIIIVVIMGGLGSISGCLYASVLVGLLSNYTTYIVPTVSLFSSIGLLVVVLLAWPRGLLPAR
ncbi:MAG: branched-chain amino acid ABC transporter permease, partial [Betaproteobacteria bacterium]|nr:branched-chain amino acid ABC transporter permease [Betaproteobacteria bacterium]